MNEIRARIGACHARACRIHPPAPRGVTERQGHLLDFLMIAGFLAVAHEPLVWLFGGHDALAEFLDVCGSTLVLVGVAVILVLFAQRLLIERYVLARIFAKSRW